MYLINHFLDKLLFGQPIPNIEQLNVTNAPSGAGSLGAHVDTCVATNTRPPNFMLVDVGPVSLMILMTNNFLSFMNSVVGRFLRLLLDLMACNMPQLPLSPLLHRRLLLTRPVARPALAKMELLPQVIAT